MPGECMDSTNGPADEGYSSSSGDREEMFEYWSPRCYRDLLAKRRR
jgi:hypothetical protein